MKSISILTLGMATLLLPLFYGCDTEVVQPESEAAIGTEIESVAESLITEDEDLGLAFMREEEKLARDIYLNLYELYGNKIFNNISKSEEVHMEEVLKLLDKYNIDDPSLETIGEFTNEALQELYDNLMTLGYDSEVSALLVGATIEDVDIRDLDLFIAKSTNTDIIKMYEFLNCGSRNHMRAFVKQLDSLGVTYMPQFITQEEFDSIITGENEKCGQSYFN